MGSARKYLALALAACTSKQYEEAGVFLAQAALEEDAEATVQELGGAIIEDPITEELPSSESSDSDDLDWGEASIDEEEDSQEESVSSVTRRKTTSLFHIGKILGAVISESSEPVIEQDDDVDAESDPDLEGETLIPASFSSVQVKSAVKSPVKLKT
jgi:geranylgeranyl pyrophosphate synthase